MKDEINEIFDDVLQQDWNYFEQKNISMTYQDRIIDKILQLFNDKIDSAEDEVKKSMLTASLNAKDIIKIIKDKVGE